MISFELTENLPPRSKAMTPLHLVLCLVSSAIVTVDRHFTIIQTRASVFFFFSDRRNSIGQDTHPCADRCRAETMGQSVCERKHSLDGETRGGRCQEGERRSISEHRRQTVEGRVRDEEEDPSAGAGPRSRAGTLCPRAAPAASPCERASGPPAAGQPSAGAGSRPRPARRGSARNCSNSRRLGAARCLSRWSNPGRPARREHSEVELEHSPATHSCPHAAVYSAQGRGSAHTESEHITKEFESPVAELREGDGQVVREEARRTSEGR